MRRFLILPLLPLLLAANPNQPDWMRLARKLTGEGDAGRARVVKALKSIPGIEGLLREALRIPEPYLALDAIVALRLTSLYNDVLKASLKDRAGFSYLALDALVTPAQEKLLADIYRERIGAPETSAAAKVVMIDSLIRMKEKLPEDELARLLLENESPEVKSAALYYLRGFLVTYQDRSYLPLFKGVLESGLSRQRRVQALALASELPQPTLKELGVFNLACSGDLPPNVEATCERLAGKAR
jgi:hypothetical protein